MPRTATAAPDRLLNLGDMINASGWERAAIVAALIGPAPGAGPGRGKSGVPHSFPHTIKSLTALRIVGLRDNHTIMRYRDAWYEAGMPTPEFGKMCDLPDLDWPPDLEAPGRNIGDQDRRDAITREAQSMGTGASKALDIASNPKAMAAAIRGDDKVAEAAETALLDRILVAGGASPTRSRQSVGEPEPRWNKLTRRIELDLVEVVGAISEMRADGKRRQADRAATRLREVLAKGIADLEEIPDTVEGLM
jgi:hypothetical protein